MVKSLRIGTALSALGMVGMLSACTTSGSSFANRSSIFGDKVDKSNIGLATKAQVSLQKGDVDSAVHYAERAVDNTGNDAGFRALLGNSYFAAGRFASAEMAYRDSLALMPNQPKVILKLALVSIAQGKHGQAVSLLEVSRPMLDASDYGLALALGGQPQRAIETLEAVARQPGAGATIRQNLALAYALAGDWTQARTVAAQDLSPAMVDQRIQQWMVFSKPNSVADQVASLTGVTPAPVDPGQPVRLALKTDNDRFAAIMPRTGTVSAPVAIAEAAPAPAFAPPAEAADTIADFAAAEPAPAPAARLVTAPQPKPVEEAAPVKMASADPTQEAPAIAAAAPADTKADELAPKPSVSAKPVEAKLAKAEAKPAPRNGNSDAVVQLGAFSSKANVKAAWKRYAAKHGSLDGFSPKTTTVMINGKKLYRLAVGGFDSVAEAKGFCSSLQGAGQACFVRSGKASGTVRFASAGRRAF